MSKIKDALLKQEPEDKIYIGDVAEKFYNSQAGELLRAVSNGLQSTEIERHTHDHTTNSDLKMGRIEGIQMIINAFEDMIQEKEAMQDVVREDNKYEGTQD